MYLDDETFTSVGDGLGVSIQIVLLKPNSRGEVMLASSNPAYCPLISHNMLKDPRDMEAMITVILYHRRTLEAKPLADRVQMIVTPNPNDFSDEALAAHCRKVVKPLYMDTEKYSAGRRDVHYIRINRIITELNAS